MGLPTIGPRLGRQPGVHERRQQLARRRRRWCRSRRRRAVPDPYQGHRWFEPDVDSLAAACCARSPAIRRAARAKARRRPRRADRALRPRRDRRALRRAGAGRGWSATARRLAAGSRARCAARSGATPRWRRSTTASPTASMERGHRVIQRAPGHRPDRRRRPRHQRTPGRPTSTPVTVGPTVVILPWEFGAPPREWVEKARAERGPRLGAERATCATATSAAGMPPGIVEVVPNGVDLQRFSPDGPRRELPRRRGLHLPLRGRQHLAQGHRPAARRLGRGLRPGRRRAARDQGLRHRHALPRPDGRRGDPRRSPSAPTSRRSSTSTTTCPPDELAGALPRRRRARHPLPRRGLLHARARGDGLRPAGDPHRRGPTAEFVPDDGGWAVPAERAPLPETGSLPELAAPGLRARARAARRWWTRCAPSPPTRQSAARRGAARAAPRRRTTAGTRRRGRRGVARSGWRRGAAAGPRDRPGRARAPRRAGALRARLGRRASAGAPRSSAGPQAVSPDGPRHARAPPARRRRRRAGRGHPRPPQRAGLARTSCPTWRSASPDPPASQSLWRPPTRCWSIRREPPGPSSPAGPARC